MKPIHYLLLSLLLSSCSHNSSRSEYRKHKENALALMEFITENSSLVSAPVDDIPISIGLEYLSQIKSQKGTAIVYLVNAGCSVCIADYISFLKSMERLKDKTVISVYAVLNTNNEDVLSYLFRAIVHR